MTGSASSADLTRFVVAQNEGDTYDHALAELRDGRKRSHWMWFVFPQVAGLGRSSIAREFALADLAEARAFLAHPVLGERLRECCRAVLEIRGSTAVDVLGPVDAMKLRSSMTLFARAAPDEPVFGEVLDAYFDGEADDATDRLLTTAD
ncbi:DUF1810 domain-containing protein [Nocardioides currus]|uniref:DUF1810 domain-containing protein n=1 Tax=Nocardioides currus TaxID=2133958 RepID=A0A2R7YUU9_9ACTN|nr:DUF1810 domain-containing protein [Nocardioides currus]PUA80152.1 DUF1810 domain-containing protein [Nocardioides currus]